MIRYTGPRVSFMAQRHPIGSSACCSILTKDLADDSENRPRSE
jgi:hypothetical protein